MLVKLLTLLVILTALGYLLLPGRGRIGRAPSSGLGSGAARLPAAHDLEKCGRCGIWMPAGEGCDCEGRA